LVGYVATLITEAGFLGPEAGRLGRILAEEGPDAPELAPRVRRILLVSRIDLVVLVLVIADMVFQPT
jgi:hypothetical protein